jgi:hypothetical protein
MDVPAGRPRALMRALKVRDELEVVIAADLGVG